MDMIDDIPGTSSDPSLAVLPWRMPGGAEVQVQPVPRAVTRIVSTAGRGIARDRLRLWSMYGQRYRQTMAAVARTLPESESLWGSSRSSRVGALADLAAVQLYLTEEWAWLDKTMLEGLRGAHLPLARCVASGLRRLLCYRGPAIVQTGTVGMVMDWYRQNRFVIDWGFWTASTSAAALSEGGPGFMVWSLTGRRVERVDPCAPDRLVFSPGTRFKVLRITEGKRPLVLMRELFPPEPAKHRTGGFGVDHTKWLDQSTVAELERVAAARPTPDAVDASSPHGRLPGLIVTSKAAGRAGAGGVRPRNEVTRY
ncbi:hypothetical protein ACWD7F_35920 [Streptomyces sp. NPDC005122]